MNSEARCRGSSPRYAALSRFANSVSMAAPGAQETRPASCPPGECACARRDVGTAQQDRQGGCSRHRPHRAHRLIPPSLHQFGKLLLNAAFADGRDKENNIGPPFGLSVRPLPMPAAGPTRRIAAISASSRLSITGHRCEYVGLDRRVRLTKSCLRLQQIGPPRPTTSDAEGGGCIPAWPEHVAIHSLIF